MKSTLLQISKTLSFLLNCLIIWYWVLIYNPSPGLTAKKQAEVTEWQKELLTKILLFLLALFCVGLAYYLLSILAYKSINVISITSFLYSILEPFFNLRTLQMGAVNKLQLLGGSRELSLFGYTLLVQTSKGFFYLAVPFLSPFSDTAITETLLSALQEVYLFNLDQSHSLEDWPSIRDRALQELYMCRDNIENTRTKRLFHLMELYIQKTDFICYCKETQQVK